MTVIKSDFSVLEKLDRWLNLSEDEQDAVVKDLEQQLRGEYIHLYTLNYSRKSSFRVPTFKHLPTGLEFNFIGGGQFNMGFSVQEEEAVRSLVKGKQFFLNSFDYLRPVHTVRVRPFLMSRFPILSYFAREHLELEPDDFISEFTENEDDIVP